MASDEQMSNDDDFEQRLLKEFAEIEPYDKPSVVSMVRQAEPQQQERNKMAVNLEKVKARATQPAAGSGGDRYLKLEADETRIRILPPRADMDEVPFVERKQHYINGKYIDCLGEPGCPICARMREIQSAQSDHEGKDKVWKRYGASRSYLYNVVCGGEMKILSATSGLHKRVLAAFLNPEVGDISDTQQGFDFLVKRTKKGTANDYSLSDASRKSTPLADADRHLSALYDLNGEAKPRMSREALEAVAAQMK